jgi:hypothetical protein
MKTDALVEALARDAKAVHRPIERHLAVLAAVGFLLAATGFAWALGPRKDIVVALSSPFFLLKMAVVLLLALTVFPMISAAARPGAKVPVQLLWLVLVVIGIGIAADLGTWGPGQSSQRLMGTNSYACLSVLPTLSALPLALVLAGLRQGAPTWPGLAGALAGLFAGSLGAILYAIHCTDDSPLFIATWYPLAIGLVSLLGAAIGRIVLRW